MDVAPTAERTVALTRPDGKRVPVVVVPQRHARLRRKLSGDDFAQLMSKDYGHNTYRLLGILVPDLHRKVPEWEWEGFAREQDWRKWVDTGEDPRSEEQADKEDEFSPLTDEIVTLFETAFKVSGAQRLGKLFDLAQMAGTMGAPQKSVSEQPTPVLPASPGTNGESA